MYKHILVPTDGSETAAKAFQAAVTFAAETGARITGYCAIQDMNLHHIGEYLTQELVDEFDRRAHDAASDHAAKIGEVARAAGVRFDWEVGKAAQPHEGIISAAEHCGADLIVMASHGLGGLTGVIIGSVTQKVLSHTKIPVLVLR
jgi:nucleotide-binding universal stress UspA family protein